MLVEKFTLVALLFMVAANSAVALALPAAAAPQRARVQMHIDKLKVQTVERYTSGRLLALQRARLVGLVALIKATRIEMKRHGTSLLVDDCAAETERRPDGGLDVRAYCELKTSLTIVPMIAMTCERGLAKAGRTGTIQALEKLVLMTDLKSKPNSGQWSAPSPDGPPQPLKIRIYDDVVISYGADGIFIEETTSPRESDILPHPIEFHLGEWEIC